MAGRPLGNVLDELEQALVGPVDVLEHEDRRSLLADPLEEGAPGREQLLALERAKFLQPEQAEQLWLDPAPLALIGDIFVEGGCDLRSCRRMVVAFGEPGTLTDHFAERPERDALAVGRGAALMPEHALDEPVDVLKELPGQAALAGPCLAGDRHKPQPPLACCRMEEVLEQSELLIASDEWRFEPLRAADAADLGDDALGSPGDDRSSLALQQLFAGRLVGNRLGRGLIGRLAHKDAARRCHRLEAACGVDQVARDHALVRGAERDGRLAGQHRSPGLDGLPVLVGAERAHDVDQVEGRADGACRSCSPISSALRAWPRIVIPRRSASS